MVVFLKNIIEYIGAYKSLMMLELIAIYYFIINSIIALVGIPNFEAEADIISLVNNYNKEMFLLMNEHGDLWFKGTAVLLLTAILTEIFLITFHKNNFFMREFNCFILNLAVTSFVIMVLHDTYGVSPKYFCVLIVLVGYLEDKLGLIRALAGNFNKMRED